MHHATTVCTWQVLVAVRAHVNMWGLYEDELVCAVEGLQPVTLPVRLGVCGSPIVLHDAVLGLSLRAKAPVGALLGSLYVCRTLYPSFGKDSNQRKSFQRRG